MNILTIPSLNTIIAGPIAEPKKNFSLSEKDFLSLVERLQSGDEYLIQVIFSTHFEVCRKFLMGQMGATYDDAYDITKETLIKFRKSLIEGKLNYGNLAALFTIAAKNNYLKLVEKRQKSATNDISDLVLNIPDQNEEALYDEALIGQLKSAILKLCTDCRELLDWHYYLDMSQREIADRRLKRGEVKFIQEDAVKSKLAECRKKLKKLL